MHNSYNMIILYLTYMCSSIYYVYYRFHFVILLLLNHIYIIIWSHFEECDFIDGFPAKYALTSKILVPPYKCRDIIYG